MNSQRDKGMARLIPGRRNRFDLADTRWNTEPGRSGLLGLAWPEQARHGELGLRTGIVPP